MKALLYLVVLVAVGLAIAWFGFGVHPQEVWYKVTSGMGVASEQGSDISSTGSRMKEVGMDHINKALDKSGGNIEVDDPYAYPNARP